MNNKEKLDSNEINNFLNKDILTNLTKKISFFQIDENEIINYKINQIGKMFKLSRIKDTLKDIQKISNIIYFEDNNNIIIYIININRLKLIIKKNQKKVKFIGIDEEDRTLNVHIFNSEDSIKKFKLENNNNENCISF